MRWARPIFFGLVRVVLPRLPVVSSCVYGCDGCGQIDAGPVTVLYMLC